MEHLMPWIVYFVVWATYLIFGHLYCILDAVFCGFYDLLVFWMVLFWSRTVRWQTVQFFKADKLALGPNLNCLWVADEGREKQFLKIGMFLTLFWRTFSFLLDLVPNIEATLWAVNQVQPYVMENPIPGTWIFSLFASLQDQNHNFHMSLSWK